MKDKASSSSSSGKEGSSSSAIRPRAWIPLLLFFLCCVVASEASQRGPSGSDGHHSIQEELIAEGLPLESGKEFVDGSGSQGQGKMSVDHGALDNLDDYVNAKRKLNVGKETYPGKSEKRKGSKGFKGEHFQVPDQRESGNYRKSGEYARLPSEHSSEKNNGYPVERGRPLREHSSEKNSDYPVSGLKAGPETMPLVPAAGDETGKRDKVSKHEFSITGVEERLSNQPLPSEGPPRIGGRGGGRIDGGGDTAERQDHLRLKQRKNNRKHNRVSSRSKKSGVPVSKEKSADFESQNGILEKDALPVRGFRHESNPASVHQPHGTESTLKETPDREDIDHSRHSNLDGSGKEKDKPLLGDDESFSLNQAQIIPEVTRLDTQGRISGYSHVLSSPSSGLGDQSQGHIHHDGHQESPSSSSSSYSSLKAFRGPESLPQESSSSSSLKGFRRPKILPSLSREDQSREHIPDQRESRGRRHLDGEGKEKADSGREGLEGEASRGNPRGHHISPPIHSPPPPPPPPPSPQPPPLHPQPPFHPHHGGHFLSNLTDYSDGFHDPEGRQKMSMRRPPDPAEDGDDVHYPPEYYWNEFNEFHQFGVGSPPLYPEDIGSDSGCPCWDTEAEHPEVECKCSGPNITHIPANLSDVVFRITVIDAALETLRNDSFTRYHETLQDIVLQNVTEFHSIEPGAFSGLGQLRSIYIHSAPKLTLIRNLTFTEDKLKSLRIVSSGLERVPNMQFKGHKEIFHMIELDSNRIQRIHSRSLQVRVEQLSLNYNHIQSVEREAFSGSDIGKLSLKGNRELIYLHPDAFEGIGSLRTLDLSETSITALPTSGLKNLEVLMLENTPTLKVFPSVYSFRTIKKAFLTYPYHCCAFQFPEQHDREQHINHKKIKELEQEHCSEVTSPSSPATAPTTRLRRRRQATLHLPAKPTPAGGFRNPRPKSTGPPSDIELIRRNRPSSNEDEEWGNVRSEDSDEDDVIILSTVRTRGFEQIKLRRSGGISERGSNRLLDDNESSVLRNERETQVPENLALRKNKRNVKSVLMTDGSIHSKTRHFVSRGRRSRPRLNSTISERSDSKFLFRDEKDIDDLSPSRRQPRPWLESPRSPKLAESQSMSGRRAYIPKSKEKPLYNSEFIPVPNKRFETETALDDSQPDEVFEPVPDKRFGIEEIPGNGVGPMDDGFVGGAGGGGGGGFSKYILGFGAFNHSADRYPPDNNRHNETQQQYHFGGTMGDPQNPPLDLEDLPRHYGFDENGGGFADEAQFPDDPSVGGGEVNDKKLEEDDMWHRTRAPMNNTTIVVMCGNLSKNYHDVMCVPAPDAFNPCEDIMGNICLRIAVWFVVVTAVVGNLAVMLVLISSKFRMTVSKFLMVNLALADLSMGIYLLIIASMDLHTIGVYFNHAIDWQNGPACKVAGFLTVFASELSIFTLTVITSERWYAITYAIHLNKRLKLSMAAKIMVVGWIYSITMATLPLVGISGYSKTSICLPMETGDALALAYLISLLLVNGLAFFVITACYASMYCSISRHDASASHSDLTVAKRMALLVFTDFACWAPIAFFGLTAVAGIPLINVTRAKILLVFFYPLNSCANPYLYAILTKQYRRDLFILLERYGFCTKRAMRYKGAYSSVNNTFPHNTVVNAPNHRNSTLTQITLCDLTRAARTSQQSNNGSLLGTMIGGSQDSLQRHVSPSRTPTKPETCGGDTERLSTVQEMSHSNHSDEDNNSEQCLQQQQQQQQQKQDSQHNDEVAVSCVVKQAGSPHPIKNCYTRLSFTPEQEQILKHALSESKVKKMKLRSTEIENGGSVTEEENGSSLIRGNEGVESDCLPSSGQGEAIVMCEVEVNGCGSSPQEGDSVDNKYLDEATEATSAV